MTQKEFREKVKNLDWLAGFFDGEGCIYIKEDTVKNTVKGKQYKYPEIQVIFAQSGDIGLALMQAIQEEYSFGKITSKHGSLLTKQVPYMTRTSGKKAVKFLKLLEPHLVVKQNKAQQAIKLGETHFGNQ